MPSIDEIARRRSLPGILVFNEKQAPVYFSAECLELLKEINDDGENPEAATPPIPNEVYRLMDKVGLELSPEPSQKQCHAGGIFRADRQYLIRATPLLRAAREADKGKPHLMVFIEKFSLVRHLDIGRLGKRFALSEREAQVVGEIVKGYTNSEIAKALFISEHTVKDHIKNIMNKLGVHNRTSIFCRVFE